MRFLIRIERRLVLYESNSFLTSDSPKPADMPMPTSIIIPAIGTSIDMIVAKLINTHFLASEY